jgi:predicted permease
MPSPARDIRHGVRLLVKHRAFTAAALLTLALCIGANTAIFSVLNSVLLKPLPFEGADRLVRIYSAYPGAGVERGGASVPDYYDRQRLPAFEHVALFTGRGMTVGESGRPERVRGAEVTPSFFAMLGVPAMVGRTFAEAEGEAGSHRVAVLSWGLWQERFGGEGDAVGRTIRIDDVAYDIVGVMPRNFVFEDRETRVWVPLVFSAEDRSDQMRHANNWEMIARLRPGVGLGQAQQQIDALNAATDERLPQYRELLTAAGFHTIVTGYHSDLTRDVRGTLWLLQAGVVLVLLIGTINIANLVLVRSTSRHRELATRAALGADRRRLAGQMLTESLVLALLGGVLGVIVGWLAVRGFSSFAMPDLPRSAEIAVDATTLLAAFGVAAVAGLLFGALPVARLFRADLSSVFRDEGRSGTASRATHAWRGALVVAQVALAFALLVGAGLMIASFARTLGVDPGFRPTNVLTAAVSLPVTRYADAAARRNFSDQLLERVRAVPGVESADITDVLPFGGSYNASAVMAEGYEPGPGESLVAPVNSRVGVEYFDAMGIRVRAGRAFDRGDIAGALPVAIVDRTLAQRYWPNEDAIGRRIAPGVPIDGMAAEFRTIVGVVDDVRVRSLTGDEPIGHFYVPVAQEPTAQPFIVVRTALPPETITNALRTAVLDLDADLPLHGVRTLETRLAESLAAERLRMILLGAFGVLALFLAATGLYGVLAYSVAQRQAEIGIRMALGSSAAAIFALVLRQGARLVAIGLAFGVIGSIVLGRIVRSMLYGVAPADPVVLLGVLAALTATAFAACVLPARRAMQVEPMSAMRDSA